MKEKYEEYLFVIAYTIIFILSGGLDSSEPAILFVTTYVVSASFYLLTKVVIKSLKDVNSWYLSKLNEYMARDRNGSL